MGQTSVAIRMIVAMGAMGIAVMFALGWGLKVALQPSDAQLVDTQSGVSSFNGERAYGDLIRVVSFGPRVPGTDQSARAREFIKTNLESAGLEVREQSFTAQTPLGEREMTNVTGIVKGNTDEVIILGNHYDTKYMPDIPFVGANDGGSTTAWMMEMARTLGPAREGHTIWLCFFDGEEAFKDWTEEDSLYGSRAFVDHLKETGDFDRVSAMVNVDMIGDCYLGIFKDRDAPGWLTRIIWDTAEDAGYGRYFLPVRHDVEDDHVPFRRAGIPAANLIDFRYGGSIADHNRNWHTVNDTVERVCAESLKAVGDVICAALPKIESRLNKNG